jgi:hypothetical protein
MATGDTPPRTPPDFSRQTAREGSLDSKGQPILAARPAAN